MHIDDPEDPRVADYRAAVRDRASGLFLCEGRFVVSRLLAAPRFRARSILATPRALEDLREALGVARIERARKRGAASRRLTTNRPSQRKRPDARSRTAAR